MDELHPEDSLKGQLARTFHQLSAAASDPQHPTAFSRFGVLTVLSSKPTRKSLISWTLHENHSFSHREPHRPHPEFSDGTGLEDGVVFAIKKTK
jgi:hypothetical protein